MGVGAESHFLRDWRARIAAEALPRTRIVVLEVALDGEPCVFGAQADSVHEVIELDASQIEPAPRLAARWRAEISKGLARRGSDFIIVLDVNAVFGNDLTVLGEEAASAA